MNRILNQQLNRAHRVMVATAAMTFVAVSVVVAAAPTVDPRTPARIPTNIENEALLPAEPMHAFADLPELPVWLQQFLTPQGREALTLMIDYFKGTSVEAQLNENLSIRGNLFDAAPAKTHTPIRTNGRAIYKASSADRDRAFRRLTAIARTEGTVRVIVKVDVPGIETLTAQSVQATGSNVAANVDATLTNAIRTVATRELAKLAGVPHTVNHTYSFIPYVALEASEAALLALEQSPGVIFIEKDRLARPMLSWGKDSMEQIGADVTRDEGFDGSGIHVAILDTGVLTSHEAFTGKNIVEACFSTGSSGGDCPNGANVDTTSASAAQPFSSDYSGYDHGTHVAGIACGTDPDGAQLRGRDLQPNKGIYGVAPAAGLIAIQVFHKVESRVSCRGQDKCVLANSADYNAAMDYVYSLRNTHTIASVNMSLGGGKFSNQSTCDSDSASTKTAIDLLRSAGIATVIASGNEDYCDGVASPGCISSAVAVGAVDSDDDEASFSNYLDSLLDIYAPGVSIKAAVASATDDYGKKNGTSMAAPHVAGAWAVLKQNSPGASVDAVLQALQSTGETVNGRCADTPNEKRIQIDAAFFRHNGRLASLGSGEVAADFFWSGVPGGFFAARRLYDTAPHEVHYFYETYLEPPVLTLEYAIRNDSGVAWNGYQIDLFGADFIGLNGGDRRGPQARPDGPVIADSGFAAGDILFLTQRGEIAVADSWIERDGDDATLTITFADPVDPGETFLLAYFVDDAGMRDKSFRMVSTPIE